MRLYIIGAGPGHEDFLTARARAVISGADMVLATPRLHRAFSHLNPGTVAAGLAEIPARIREAKDTCASLAVLVSGDSGFFSAGRGLAEEFSGWEVTCLNGLSSLQYFCARLGICYEGIKAVSVHGRAGHGHAAALPPGELLAAQVLPHVAYTPLVFVLTGGGQSARAVIETLCLAGLGHVFVHVGENLSLADEHLTGEKAATLAGREFSPLSSLIIRNESAVNPFAGLPDSAFTRSPGHGESPPVPMTKQAVRALILDSLDIQPGDFVADIGAGTGSVAVAMARKAHQGMVWAMEKDEAAYRLCRENIARLGAFNVRAVHREAGRNAGTGASCLPGLPPVDKAFIGGSGGAMEAIVSALRALNPAVRLAATAVTLETLHQAVRAFTAAGCASKVSCLNIAQAEERGAYHLMRAENPVYIISGARHAG